jgi:hypothetical protein
MNMQSVKARFTGSYLFLLILFVIQIPIVYILVGEMNKKYAQVDLAGGLRMRAVQITSILDRHIMTGNESLEGLYQEKKAEYPKVLESFKTGTDNMAAVKDQELLAGLATVESEWNELLVELEKGMEYGDDMRLKKEEIENSTLPLVDKLSLLSGEFMDSGDPALLGLLEDVGDLKFSTVEMSFMFEKYIITFQEKDALTAELSSDIKIFEQILAKLASAIERADVDSDIAGNLKVQFADINAGWELRRDSILGAFNANVLY